MWKKSLKVGIFLSLLLGFITILSVYQWSKTDHGVLPSKTAVLLHAINHDLVPVNPDIEPPAFLQSSSSTSGHVTMIRDDLTIPVEDQSSIPIRIYRYSNAEDAPVILYYHGGAFMEGYGDIDTHDNIVRSLAARTGSVVVSVGYRVAPEHIFPTAVNDSYEALLWMAEHAEEYGGNPDQIVVAGDSAGGNLAAVTALRARNDNGPSIAAQILYYPLTTFRDVDFQSRSTYDSGYYLLSRSVMLKARQSYTPEEAMWNNPYTSPLEASTLENLPPTFVVTAEYDPLRDEGEKYAEKLYNSGVPVDVVRYKGVMHGFVSFYEVMQSGDRALTDSAHFLQRTLNDPSPATKDSFTVRIQHPPKGMDRLKEEAEAFAIAAFLIGKSTMSSFPKW